MLAHDISSLTFGGITTWFSFVPPTHHAQKISDDLMQKISTQNRRALDLVAAKCYYYHARVYEFLDKLDVVRRYESQGHHYYTVEGLMGVRSCLSHCSVAVKKHRDQGNS